MRSRHGGRAHRWPTGEASRGFVSASGRAAARTPACRRTSPPSRRCARPRAEKGGYAPSRRHVAPGVSRHGQLGNAPTTGADTVNSQKVGGGGAIGNVVNVSSDPACPRAARGRHRPYWGDNTTPRSGDGSLSRRASRQWRAREMARHSQTWLRSTPAATVNAVMTDARSGVGPTLRGTCHGVIRRSPRRPEFSAAGGAWSRDHARMHTCMTTAGVDLRGDAPQIGRRRRPFYQALRRAGERLRTGSGARRRMGYERMT